MNLNGKTALVTGGAVRIGKAICVALAGQGCNVIIHYNHSAGEAGRLAGMLQRKGVDAWLVRGDLSSESGCRKVLEDAVKEAGKVSFLINNAAVFHKDGLMSVTEDKFMAELAVNFLAPAALTKEFAHYFKSRKKGAPSSGKIINLLDRRIASIEPGCLPYMLSKKMLAEYTRSSALELAPHITVNGVAPGAILPPPFKQGAGASPKGRVARVRDFAGKTPLEKRCTPADVAEAVVFLLESDGITGQVIFVDGGQHLLGNIGES